MRRAAMVGVVLWASPAAFADPTPAGSDDASVTAAVDRDDDAEREALDEASHALLQLRPIPLLEAADAQHDSDSTTVQLAPNLELVSSGSWWQANRDDPNGHSTWDVPGRGWEASTRLERRFGGWRVSAFGAVGELETQRGGGRYFDAGIALVRAHRFSRWTTGWIALSLGFRHWAGQPPPAEPAQAVRASLSIGLTFK